MKSALVLFLVFACIATPSKAQLFSAVENTSGVLFNHNGGVDVDSNSGSFIMNVGTGAVWFDYDNDGDLDLYVTQRNDGTSNLRNLLFENNGAGVFSDVTTARNAEDSVHQGCGASAADFDNDGDEDLYLANCDDDVILVNQLTETGSPNFLDGTLAAFGTSTPVPERGQSASWGDWNGDGWLDIYVANHMFITPPGSSQDYLFTNNGDGTFTDDSARLNTDADGDGVDDRTGFGFIGVFTDFDTDGDQDIYLANDCPFGVAQGFGRTEDNKLWRNNGDGTFTEISDTIGPLTTAGKDANEGTGAKPDCQNAMGMAIGDPDRDGDLDYFYTNLENNNAVPGVQSATMVENQGSGAGNFVDVTTGAGLFEALVPDATIDPDTTGRITWGSVFLDYDLDGLEDLAVAAGAINDSKGTKPEPNMLYHNLGSGGVSGFQNGTAFADVSIGSGFEDPRRGKTVIMGDYDLDGDPDLAVVSFGERFRLMNNLNANANNWLIVKVQGAGPALSGSNKDGIGARVQITTPDLVTQTREIHSGSSLGGGDDMAAYFGLGTNNSASVTVTFLGSGTVQTAPSITANQRVTIREFDTPLPIELAHISAVREGDKVHLSWNTSSETDNIGFEVQHRLNDGQFERVTFVDGAGTTGEGRAYSYELTETTPGRHSYRLRQFDASGQFAISPSVEVTVELPSAFALSAPYPNPFGSQAHFTLAVQKAQAVNVGVYDILGRQVKTLYQGVVSANDQQQFTIDGAGLSSGLYMIRVTGEHFSTTRQVALIK